MNTKLLIVEDDNDISTLLKDYLSKVGYNIEVAKNGIEGLQKIKEFSPSLIILDLMMPIMDGYTMLSKLREFSEIPVILLTAKGQQSDKVMGFIKGCDDYVVKPFDLVEVEYRIKAVLKRGAKNIENNTDIIRYKDLVINKREYKVVQNEEELKLTKTEFDILNLLVSNQGRVYSTKNIYELIWKESFLENDNAVLTHIRNLREKLGDKLKSAKYIKTKWGVGYKVEKDT